MKYTNIPNMDNKIAYIPLTNEEKKAFNNKCRLEGKTQQGVLRSLVISYIEEEKNNG